MSHIGQRSSFGLYAVDSFGKSLKSQDMLFQTAPIMPHNTNITHGKIPLFVIPFEKNTMHQFWLQEMQSIVLNILLVLLIGDVECVQISD